MRWRSVTVTCMSLLGVLVLCEPANKTNAKTTILKCCKTGEELTEPSEDGNSSCKDSSVPWMPIIYSQRFNNVISYFPDNWNVIESKRPQCQKANHLVTYLPDVFVLLEVGDAVYVDGKDKGLTFKPGEYCSDSNALLACAPRKTETDIAVTRGPKVFECCGLGAVFDESRRICVIQNESEAVLLLPNASSTVRWVPSFPICRNSSKYEIVGSTKDALLKPDGGLEVNGIVLPARQFCVERVKEFDGAPKVFACWEYVPQSLKVKTKDIRFILYSVSFIINAIFLAATIAAGWLMPASYRGLQWRCQTYYFICLMFGDILMATIQLASDSLYGGICVAFAIMAHFFFLATFFWLNTMCFNIWWTFRYLRLPSLEKGQETLKLRIYACYAWGGSLFVAGMAALLDNLPSNYTFLRPRFGVKSCWFYGDMEILVYFFVPIGILMTANVMFFVATARELTCGLWKSESVKSTTERVNLRKICMKLVIVMGVTWIADIVSWLVGGPHYLWYFTDLLNALQGVFIFMVVGWHPEVRAGLKRLFNRNPRANIEKPGNGLSTPSHGMTSMRNSLTQNPSTKTSILEAIS